MRGKVVGFLRSGNAAECRRKKPPAGMLSDEAVEGKAIPFAYSVVHRCGRFLKCETREDGLFTSRPDSWPESTLAGLN